MEARFEQVDMAGASGRPWVTPTSKCYRILGKEGITSFEEP